jgi:hypothetical protein
MLSGETKLKYYFMYAVLATLIVMIGIAVSLVNPNLAMGMMSATLFIAICIFIGGCWITDEEW